MLNHNRPLRNIELRIAYDGRFFSGWQVQPNEITVQGELQERLRIILKEPELRISGASRTDSGVHAHDQRVGVRTVNPIPLKGLRRVLQESFSGPLRVLEVRECERDFCVRFGAQAKHYAFFIGAPKTFPPIAAPFLWEYGYSLDYRPMAKAAEHLVGTHCFGAFQSAKDQRESSMTTIYATRVQQVDDLISFEVVGHRFLYLMVRNMVGSLVKVGQGLWSPDEFVARMRSGDRKSMGMTAPAHGLHLVRVFYNETPDYDPLSQRLHRFLASSSNLFTG